MSVQRAVLSTNAVAGSRCAAISVLWVLWAAGCSLAPLKLDGRACPCVDGYTCGVDNVCVKDPNDSSSGNGGEPGGGGDGPGGTAGQSGGDGDVGGGDGDVGGDGDGDVGGGDGDGDGDAVVEPPRVCTPVAPVGDCPPECDTCEGGVCTFDCTGSLLSCIGATKTCPPGWPCIMNCAPGAGVAACTTANLICADGPCELLCNAASCSAMDVTCGTGPCHARCVAGPSVACGQSCDCPGGCE